MENKISRTNSSKLELYPCSLSYETDQLIVQLSKDLVKAWGDRTLSSIELEERIATAAEKAPTEDLEIKSLREVMSKVRSEFDSVIAAEECRVREAGGLHVIGTERHESRRVDNQLRGELVDKEILVLHVSFFLW